MDVLPFFQKQAEMDGAPACLRMIAKYYGRTYSHEYLSKLCKLNPITGVLLSDLVDAAKKIDFCPCALQVNTAAILHNFQLPCITLVNKKYIVIYKMMLPIIAEELSRRDDSLEEEPFDKDKADDEFADFVYGISLLIANPAEEGLQMCSMYEFIQEWIPEWNTNKDASGIILQMPLSVDFFLRGSSSSLDLEN